jgi:hypothetical protein
MTDGSSAEEQPKHPDVSRMCPATDRENMQTDGQCRSPIPLVTGAFRLISPASESGQIGLLIRRLWVRVPPPELQSCW